MVDSIQPAVISCGVLDDDAQGMNLEVPIEALNKELGRFAWGTRRRKEMAI